MNRTQPQNSSPDLVRKTRNVPRYPNGCPISGHEGYGCTCNPIPRSG